MKLLGALDWLQECLFLFSDLVIFRSNLAHKMADRLQPVRRADAQKFKVFIKEFMQTFRYIKLVPYTI